MVQYKQQEIKGRLACKERLQKMEQTKLSEQIAQFKENIQIEIQVSEKI